MLGINGKKMDMVMKVADVRKKGILLMKLIGTIIQEANVRRAGGGKVAIVWNSI